jgi:hypothetical protein
VIDRAVRPPRRELPIPRLLRLCFGLAALLLVGPLLAACTISSDKPLLDDAAAAAPLPDAFTFFPYEWGADGYTRATDAPTSFVRTGDSYVATASPDSDGPMTVRFVPTGGDIFVIAITVADEPDMLYGFARYSDGVLAMALSPDEATVAAIAHERKTSMPKVRKALAGLRVGAQHALILDSRAALDTLTHMYAAGRLPMGHLAVGYIALAADATPPSRLVQSGTQWIGVP